MVIKQKYCTNVTFTEVDNYTEIMAENIPILKNFKQLFRAKYHNVCNLFSNGSGQKYIYERENANYKANRIK